MRWKVRRRARPARLLSTRDLRQIENLPRLRGAGVASLKLEGRLKGPEYVGVVTAAYRRALDALYGGLAPERETLKGVFNRGYTQGYGPGLVDGELLEDQTERHVGGPVDSSLCPRPIPLTASLTVRTGRPVALRVSDGADEAYAEGENRAACQGAPGGRRAPHRTASKDRRHAL